MAKHKWWTYLVPILGMSNILDDIFGFYNWGQGGLKDSSVGHLFGGGTSSGNSSNKISLGDIIQQIFTGLNGFDWESGVNSLMNYFTGGVTGSQIEAQNFSAEEAAKQRAWEQEMSNTAFQRQVSDMQAAGVNPAMMYGGAGSSGASTPSGASASSAPSLGGANLMDMIFQMAKLPAELKYLNAKARIEDTEAKKRERTLEFDVASAVQDYLNKEATKREIESRIGKNNAEAFEAAARGALAGIEGEKLNIEKFFLNFRKQLTEKYGLDPHQDNIASAVVALSMSITDHIEQGVSSAKDKFDKFKESVVAFIKAFGKPAAKRFVAESKSNGGFKFLEEDSNFNWDSFIDNTD